MQHRLSEQDLVARTATCRVCGPHTPIKPAERRPDGTVRYKCKVRENELRRAAWNRPGSKDKERHIARRKPWRQIAADRLALGVCERKVCGFVAEDSCQLDVDHIVRRDQGGTDDPDNLMVLCANCHRLKTRREQQGLTPFPE